MNTEPIDTDICILGGGLVGAALAAAIIRNTKYKCTLVEAQTKKQFIQAESSHQSTTDQRSLVLTYKTIALLKKWHIIPAIEDSYIQTIKQLDLVHRQAETINTESSNYLSLNHQDINLPYLVPYLGGVIPAAQLISQLHKQCNQSTNCNCFYQNHAQTIRIDHKQGLPIITLNSQDKLRAKLLVIAEGKAAPTAKQLNITYKTQSYAQQVCVFNLKMQDDLPAGTNPHKAWWYKIPQGSLALVPRHNRHDRKLEYGTILTLKQQHAEQWLAKTETQQLESLLQYLPESLKLIHKSPTAVYPLSMTIAQELARPHILLMGNSAASLPPLGAQSLNLSFRLAERLMQALNQNSLPLNWNCLYNLSLQMQKDIQFISQTIDYSLSYLDYLDNPNTQLINRFTGLGLKLLNKAMPIKRVLLERALGL